MLSFYSHTLSALLTLGNLWSVLHNYSFVFLRMSCKWKHTLCNLLWWLFHSASYLWDSSKLLQTSTVYSFLLLSSLLFYACNITYLLTCWRYSGCFQCLAITDKVVINMCKGFCVYLIFHFSRVNIQEQECWVIVSVSLTLQEMSKLFSRMVVPFFIPTSYEWVFQLFCILLSTWYGR